MLKDVKKASELDTLFKATPSFMIDYAYEAVSNNITIPEEYKEVFDKNIKLLETIPVGEMMKKMEVFLETDVFSSHFEVLDGMKIWKVIQHFSDEVVKQSRITQ